MGVIIFSLILSCAYVTGTGRNFDQRNEQNFIYQARRCDIAIVFDGTGDRLETTTTLPASLESLTATSPTGITLACWGYSTTADSADTMLAITDSGTNTNYFDIIKGSNNTVAASIGATTEKNSPSAASVSQNTWFSAVAVFKSATDRHVYLDGVKSTAETTSLTPSGLDIISIGTRATSTNDHPFIGRLFWAAIWDIAFDGPAATAYADGRDPRAIHGSRLVRFWRLSGPTITDRDIMAGDIMTTAGDPVFNRDVNDAQVARLGPRGRGRLGRVG